MFSTIAALVLSAASQGALFSVPVNETLPDGFNAVPVYRGESVDLYVGTPLHDACVLDAQGAVPEDYFIVYTASLHPGVTPDDYGKIVFLDSFVAITRPDSGTPPSHSSAARPLQEIHAPVNYGLIPRSVSFESDVADIVASVDQDSIVSIVSRLELFENRFWSNDSFPAARDWAVNWLVREGCPVEIQNFPIGDDSSQNIIITYPGTVHPERIYLFGAHLDSGHNGSDIFPGADDNASGSAAVMEAARAMVGYNFDSTVILCLWGAEEAGLVGSSYYAEQAWMNQDSIIAALNLDMILYGPQIGPSNYAIFNINYIDFSEDLADYMVLTTETYVPELDTHLNYTTYGGSDHVSFWQYGFVAVGGDEYLFPPWYHTSQDLLENYMDFFPFGTEIAKAATATLASLAAPNGPSGMEGGQAIPVLSVRVSPTPASGMATVHVTGADQGARVGVYDTAGRRVLTETASEGLAVLDLSNLPSGIYLVTAGNWGETASCRLVVCR